MNNHYVGNTELQIGEGKYVDIIDPDVSNISIYDIAHALSNTGRFGGHSKHFYSVAQHSVLGSIKASSIPAAWDFLLHDAVEAFLTDMPSPIKYNLPDYLKLEKVWETRLFERLGVSYPFFTEVKYLDLQALATERRDLLHRNGQWQVLDGVTPWREKIQCWHPTYARYRFLKRAYQLHPRGNIKVPSMYIPLMLQGIQTLAHLYLDRRIP